MPRPRKPTHIWLTTITTECKAHGNHRLIVGALEDETAAAACIIARALRDSGRVVHLSTVSLPIDDARIAADRGGLDLDDLPF